MTATLAEIQAEQEKRRPVLGANRNRWQHVAWAVVRWPEGRKHWGKRVVATGADGKRHQMLEPEDWGPPPTRPPKLIVVVSGNQSGKSEFAAQVTGAAASGLIERFERPRVIVGAMPTLELTTTVMRPKVERWIGTPARWTPRTASVSSTHTATRTEGVVRLKAYEQGRESFQGVTGDLYVLDEQAPDDIVNECRMRLMVRSGMMLMPFTPLGGINSALYEEAYLPLIALRRDSPGLHWGEVEPGVWVFSVGQRENAASKGGWLPDAEIDAEEARLIRLGRELEARVRIHGEWHDITEDAIVPMHLLKPWHGEVHPAGWARVVAWVDPAFSQRDTADRSCISVAARSPTGGVYLLEQDFGRWPAGERYRRFADMLAKYDWPSCYVQRVDLEFRNSFNRYLRDTNSPSGGLIPIPKKGPIPGKVERAHAFAALLDSADVHVDSACSEFRSEAGMFPHGPHDDCFDSGMGAIMMAAAGGGEGLGEANRKAERVGRPSWQDRLLDDDDPDEPGAWGFD